MELIVDDPDGTIWILAISKSEMALFGCSCVMDFEEEILKPLIDEITIKKRNLDFEYALRVISSRIIWETASGSSSNSIY